MRCYIAFEYRRGMFATLHEAQLRTNVTRNQLEKSWGGKKGSLLQDWPIRIAKDPRGMLDCQHHRQPRLCIPNIPTTLQAEEYQS